MRSGAPTQIEIPNMRHPNLIILVVACSHAFVVAVVVINLFIYFAFGRWGGVRL